MSDTYVTVNGSNIDNRGVLYGVDPVERLQQRLRLASDLVSGEDAAVIATTPGAGAYGLVTRNIPSGTQAVSIGATVTIAGVVAVSGGVDVSGSSVSIAGTATVAGTVAVSGVGGTVTVAGSVAVSGVAGTVTIAGAVSLSAALPAGTNNIGDVDVLTMPAITGTVSITGAVVLGAGAAAIGSVSVSALPALPAGNNNIGDVDIATMPAVVLAAGAAAIGSVTITGTVVLGAGAAAIGKLAANSGVNIGTVDVATLPAVVLGAGVAAIGSVSIAGSVVLGAGAAAIGSVSVSAQPARSRTVDSIAAAIQTDILMSGLTGLTPKFGSIELAADGALVAAVTSKKIRPLCLFLNSDVDGKINLRTTSAAGTKLSGDLTVRGGGGFVLPFCPVGWTETISGDGLYADITTLTKLSGLIVYLEV